MVGMAQKDLRAVHAAALRLEKARAGLMDAILAASRSGESVRDIAEFAGLSRSRVGELLTEARELERRQAD